MNNIINIENVYRDFKVLKQRKGLKGSLVNLFCREYETINAVSGLNLHIQKGEIVGFIGTNGAGKSTTIKMMIGVLKQTSGNIEINGMNPYEDHTLFAKDIGVVFGQRTQLWWALPVRESFNILKQIYEVSNQDFIENMEFYEEIVGINKLLDKPARELSLGQRTLCDILAAFLHNPSIVFLDEPTIGLDVSMKYKIHTLIKELNQKKKTTVVLTTHDMSDVSELCNRIIIMNKGNCIYDDSMDKLVKFFGNYKKVSLRFTELSNADIYKKISTSLTKNSGVQIEVVENGIELLADEKKITIMEVLNLIQQSMNIQDVNVTDISIEEIVRKIYESDIGYDKKN